MKKQMFLTLLLGAAAISTSIVEAAVRVEVPPAPGIPAYARTDFIPHNEEWAAIVFYREPACVPDGFNLLNIVDIPAAFGCPLTVAGFEIWENGPPPIDAAPIFSNLHGLGAVPVWFVSWPDLREQIADGVLTITDLASMPSLQVGSASFFDERLHPIGGAQHPNLSIVAHGRLLDGRSFQFEATASLQIKSIRIAFK
ncbi:MAG TPA: hypothetical protein VJA21_31185 [Verrucomicrobiae bacterium]